MPAWTLDRIADRFQQAAFDPALWPDVLHDLSRSVGALGAVMLPRDHRIVGTPYSPDLAAMHADYFRGGWQTRDDRDKGIPLMMRDGIATDQDFMSPDDMRRPFYRDFLERHGCRWFAGLAHVSQSGFQAISIQRTIRQGPFEAEEIRRLSTLCRVFADAVFVSRHLSLRHCTGITDEMEIMEQPAMVLDQSGQVLTFNRSAEQLMGHGLDLTRRTLSFRDPRSQANFDSLFGKALDGTPIEGPVADLTTVRDRAGMPIQLRALALRDWARFTFTNARVLILAKPPSSENLLRSTFGLTRAEVKLVLCLAAGHSVAESAASLDIAYETARSQLRSVFLKTNTNRQGQLIALVKGASVKDRS